MDRFDICFERVVGHEGGFTNDRRDRGNWTSGVIGQGQLKGTKYGISAMSYPSIDIRNMTLATAKAIYRRDFWQRWSCDKVPAGVDYLLFDAAINHGGNRAARLLQAAVGAVQDGAIGPATLRAVGAMPARKIATEFAYHRMVFYTNISTFPTYKHGWTRRAIETYGTALADISSK